MLHLTKRISKFLIALACLSFIANCGGGSSSTGAWTSSLERGTIVSTISSADRLRVCDEFNQWWLRRSSKVELCTFAGVIFTTLFPIALGETPTPATQECQEIVNQCVPQAGSGGGEEAVDCVINDVEQLQDCPATVDEMDACLSDSLQLMSQILGILSCDVAGDFAAVKAQFESFANVPPSIACESVKAKCPQLFKETEVSPPAA